MHTDQQTNARDRTHVVFVSMCVRVFIILSSLCLCFSFTAGWYKLCDSEQLGLGRSKHVHILGLDVALYRSLGWSPAPEAAEGKAGCAGTATDAPANGHSHDSATGANASTDGHSHTCPAMNTSAPSHIGEGRGLVHVLDAICPHLGANLGVNGVVRGNNLECPFHGWSVMHMQLQACTAAA